MNPAEYLTIFGYTGRVTDWLLALFTLLLVIVSAVQGWFLWGTLRATKKAADAAETTALSVSKLERAAVFVFLRLTGSLSTLSVNTLLMLFENHGRSVAVVKKVFFSVEVFETYPDRRQGPWEMIKPSSGIVPITTKPGEPEFRLSTEVDLTLTDLQEINAGRRKLLCYGIIEYADAFGDWETGWCWKFVPNGDPPGFATAENDRLNYRT